MKKVLIIISVVVAVIAAAIFGLYVYSGNSFSFIETYKKNFSENISNLQFQYKLKKEQAEIAKTEKNNEEQTQDSEEGETKTAPNGEESENADAVNVNYTNLTKKFVSVCDPIALKSAANARFAEYNGKILCVIENSVVLYNKKGEVEWTVPIQMSNPVLKVNGTYILLFEQGGKKILLHNGQKELFNIEAQEKILTGNVSANGDLSILTEKLYYKGAVVVYNKSGQEIYSRSFGKNSVLSAAISDSRRLCVSLLSTEGGVSSQVVFLDIGKKNEDVSVTFENSIVFDMEFSGNTLCAYADNAMYGLNDGGKQIWKYEYSQKTLNRYENDGSDIRLMLFDASNTAELCVVNGSGKEKQKIKEDIVPDFCDICNGYILYNGGRSLYLTKSNGTPLAKYVASRDMKNAYFIDSENILIVYNSSIEFLKIEKG